MTEEAPDEDKAFYILQEFIDEAVCHAIDECVNYLKLNKTLEKFDYEWEEEEPEVEPGVMKVGNEVFDVEYKVTRKPALEKRKPE